MGVSDCLKYSLFRLQIRTFKDGNKTHLKDKFCLFSLYLAELVSAVTGLQQWLMRRVRVQSRNSQAAAQSKGTNVNLT